MIPVTKKGKYNLAFALCCGFLLALGGSLGNSASPVNVGIFIGHWFAETLMVVVVIGACIGIARLIRRLKGNNDS